MDILKIGDLLNIIHEKTFKWQSKIRPHQISKNISIVMLLF